MVLLINKEKLTAIVQAMEWKPQTKHGKPMTLNCIEYDSEQEKYLISFFYGLDSDKEFSLPDLIFTADAMRSIWGDEKECFRSTDGCEVPDYREKECSKTCYFYIPARIYHAQQAPKLAHEQGIPAAIEIICMGCCRRKIN
jgi:hypothetical protein